MRIIIFCLVFACLAFAGSCPAGATSCFLCGGVDGIPCSSSDSCSGKYVEGVGNVACGCPQDKPCACYCPYTADALASLSDECLTDPECAAKHMPMVEGVVGYVARFSGEVMVEKAGTTNLFPAESLTAINEDDKLIIPDGGKVMVVFPGNNVRVFFGEGEVSVRKEKEALEIVDYRETTFVATAWSLTKAIIHQIRTNGQGEPAMTVTGTGNMLPEGEQVYSPFEANYEIESEAIFEGKNNTQTVKVIEGKVTVHNKNGESAVVRTGEQLTFTQDSLDASEKKPLELSSRDIWWGGLINGTCEDKCGPGVVQTPYPGCSCVEASSGNGCSPAFLLPFLLGAVLLLRRTA